MQERIKFLFILGTHRGGGNSELIKGLVALHPRADEIEAKYIYLKDYNIQECKSCYKCTDLGKCCIKDDTEAIVEVMKQNEVIIFVPVVYGFGVGSKFQKFIERAGYGYLRMQGRPLRNKIAGIAVIGRRYAHEAVAQQLVMNILLNEMIIYGSGFLPLLNGNSFPGNVMEDQEGIEAFNKMIERIAEVKRKGENYEENFID